MSVVAEHGNPRAGCESASLPEIRRSHGSGCAATPMSRRRTGNSARAGAGDGDRDANALAYRLLPSHGSRMEAGDPEKSGMAARASGGIVRLPEFLCEAGRGSDAHPAKEREKASP